MAWNRAPQQTPESAPADPVKTTPRPEPPTGASRLGKSLHLEGTVSGSEDLLIEGSLDGEVRLEGCGVTIGQSGRLEADVHGRKIVVEGQVEGNLTGREEVVIRRSGKVLGNVKAPRVTLENGSRFRGSIDMQGAAETPEAASGKAGERRPA